MPRVCDRWALTGVSCEEFNAAVRKCEALAAQNERLLDTNGTLMRDNLELRERIKALEADRAWWVLRSNIIANGQD
jgi:hypothetical protein